MIRLFVGLELPEDIKEHIYTLRGGVPNAHWIKKENLHLDLRFIGEVEEPMAADIHASLSRIRAPAFGLAFTEIGIFSTGNDPRDLWTGVSNYTELDILRNKIDKAVSFCGVPPDRHKFHAHVRIAKLKGTSMVDAQEYIAHNNLFHTKDYTVEYFTLFSTHHHQNGEGAFYQVEARYALSLI